MVASSVGFVRRGTVPKTGPCCRNSAPELDSLTSYQALFEETKGKSWQSAKLAEIIAYTVRNTDLFIIPEIDRIDTLLTDVCTGHAVAHPELLRIYTLFYWLKRDLMNHILEESDNLFPYIVRMERAIRDNEEIARPFFHSVRQSIKLMMVEHDTIEDLLRNLSAASSGFEPPHEACATFRRLYAGLAMLSMGLRDLIQLENYLLFPRAVELETEYRVKARQAQ